MLSLDDIGQKFASTLDVRPAAADLGTLRQLCGELLADVPHDQRVAMLARLGTMRRATDLWPLRTALFDVISPHCGERVAAARLVELDRRLTPYANSGDRRA